MWSSRLRGRCCLHNVAPMQLVATGKIVRCNGRQVAIQTTQHEFRTAGISAEHRNAQPGNPNNSSMLASSPVFAAFGRL